jgi:hypothetical protein
MQGLHLATQLNVKTPLEMREIQKRCQIDAGQTVQFPIESFG